MKRTTIMNLKPDERVIWPAGANGMPLSHTGTIVGASKRMVKHVKWDDGEITLCNDDAAMQFVEKASPSPDSGWSDRDMVNPRSASKRRYRRKR